MTQSRPTRAWRDALPMVGLGFVTILVVVGARQLLFSRSWSQGATNPTTTTTAARNDRTEERLAHVEASLADLRAEVDALRRQQTKAPIPITETTEQPLAATEPGDAARHPLNRGLDYLSLQSYDDAKHAKVLSDLVAAYAIPGLARDMNNALRTTIQEVNDIGTNHILSEARRLPRAKAIEQLRVFLAMTPNLTPNQKGRISTVITAYQSSRSGV